MKRCVQTAFLLLVTLCVLLTALPASAELYNWKDGSIPATWNRLQSETEIDATDLLTPVNPNASREAKNLLAYLSIQAQIQESRYFEIPLGRIELAEYLCVDRSALTRELEKMKSDGLIDYDKNCFRIL